MLTEYQMTIIREAEKHMIDIENGVYADEFLDAIKESEGGTGSQYLVLLVSGDKHRAAKWLEEFYSSWAAAFAEKLARGNSDDYKL